MPRYEIRCNLDIYSAKNIYRFADLHEGWIALVHNARSCARRLTFLSLSDYRPVSPSFIPLNRVMHEYPVTFIRVRLMMWLARIVAFLFPRPHPPRSPQSTVGWSVSFVRPVEGRRPRSKEPDGYRLEWRQAQLDADRFIVADSHFTVGKHIRSVPKLQDIASPRGFCPHVLQSRPHDSNPDRRLLLSPSLSS